MLFLSRKKWAGYKHRWHGVVKKFPSGETKDGNKTNDPAVEERALYWLNKNQLIITTLITYCYLSSSLHSNDNTAINGLKSVGLTREMLLKYRLLDICYKKHVF